MNDRLRRALHDAALDIDDVARATLVDHRTVQRWLAGRTPRPGYRRTIARLVGRDEAHLWPQVVTADRSSAPASVELVDAFAHRADLPPEAWWQLFRGAATQIDVLGYAVQHLHEHHPRLPELLSDKASDGCGVRIAIADPDCAHVLHRDDEERLAGGLAARIRTSMIYLEPLSDVAGIELRCHQTPMYNSIFRFDDQMLVTPHVYGRPGRLSPLLHLRRRAEGGIFDNFARHFEDVWATSAPLPQGARA